MAFKRTIHAVDTHAGTPMRVITGGVPHIPGNSVYEKMKWLEENDDQLRKLMLREPRGYPAHCCNIIVPPTHPEADAGYIIMEQIEYPVMSGGNTAIPRSRHSPIYSASLSVLAASIVSSAAAKCRG